MSAHARRGARSPRSAPSSAPEPRALREARLRADLLLKDLRSENPARHEPAAQRFARLPWVKPPAVGAVLTNRATLKLKHALHVVALEAGHPDWASLLAAARAADAAAPVAAAGHPAKAGLSASGTPKSRRLALYVVNWVDGNGARVDGATPALAPNAEMAHAAVAAQLREASIARCGGPAWREEAIQLGVAWNPYDPGQTGPLHLANGTLHEAFGGEPLVPAADAAGSLFFVLTPTDPATRIDGDDGPGSAVVGAVVRAGSEYEARHIVARERATVLEMYQLPDPDTWRAGVVSASDPERDT
jgi:hypothetical protein